MSWLRLSCGSSQTEQVALNVFMKQRGLISSQKACPVLMQRGMLISLKLN